jgi:hypothetical protein
LRRKEEGGRGRVEGGGRGLQRLLVDNLEKFITIPEFFKILNIE